MVLFDVCIFGCGPAGTSVAARLAQLGLTAVVLDQPRKAKTWGGESFSGAIREPLTKLGLWDDFRRAGHVSGYEQRICWGGAPWSKSSILNPQGPLWHVDRSRFDADLREAVRRCGVPIVKYRYLQVLEREGAGWRIGYDDATIRARYLVDATGRARAVARKLGVAVRNYDRLIGMAAVIGRNANPEFDHTMVIEATSLGWWYAAPVPQGHVLAFFSDSDLAPRELAQSMRPVPANSSFAQPESEQGWLTVGDACAAHDPLCGWGVHRALSNGIRAAEAIASYLTPVDPAPLEDYRRHCRTQFENYLEGLTRHYSHELRWTTAPFWQRRQNPDRIEKLGD